MVSKSRVNPEVLQTSNSLGNQAVPLYVFCAHRLGPQSTPSGKGKPFVLGTLTLSKGEGKIAVFFPPFLYFCCCGQGLLLVCRNSLGLRVVGPDSVMHKYVYTQHAHTQV